MVLKNKYSLRISWILVFTSILLKSCSERTDSFLGPIAHPKDNPQNPEIAKLGEKLFFDTRLSANNSISCATCHKPGIAFSDAKPKSIGIHGNHSMRNAPSLFNVAYQKKFMADGEIPTLEMQALVPLQDSNEMGNNMGNLIKKLRNIKEYQLLAKSLFQRDFDAFVLTRSLAQYERTLLSDHSPFDQWYIGKNQHAISNNAKQGWKIFSEELFCTRCHPAPLFSNLKVENNGLYSDYSKIEDKGRFRIHGDTNEIGSFKVPTLRNCSKTAPYMHDGSMKTLEEVIEFYAKGGNKHKNQSRIIQPFQLTNDKRVKLIAFLKSLED